MTFATDSRKPRQELRNALLDLISAERFTRRAAAERLPVDWADARFALRRTLFHDPHAPVRAAAASRLGQVKDDASDVAAWLCDAAGDAVPLVREAALRALSRLCGAFSDEKFGAPLPIDIASICERRCLEDPVWWVRRAAVVALYALHGVQALPTLRRVLADPFWRVRHTAVQALLSLGEADAALRPRILQVDPQLPALTQSGLWYLRARWQPEIDVHAFAAPPIPDDEQALQNPDPAVMTARLRARPAESLDPMELVPLLADPHQPLRQLAAARLRTRQHLPSLRAALSYLETPAPPHAFETVSALLSRLGDTSRVLCDEILRGENPPRGALTWACQFAATTQDCKLRAPILQKLRTLTVHSSARIAMLQALAALSVSEVDQSETRSELLHALANDEVEVRSAAAIELSRHADDAQIYTALWSRPLDHYKPLAASAIVETARKARDVSRLRQSALCAHSLPRMQALDALCRLDAPSNLSALLIDADPTVRAVVLRGATADVWVQALSNDIDPLVRRRALSLLIARRRGVEKDLCFAAAKACSTSADSWLRVHGCELLDATQEREREVLITLTSDRDLGVRAAAASRLEIAEAQDHFAARVNEILAGPAPASTVEKQSEESFFATPSDAPRRVLGRTGIAVSPLGLSGAYDPPASAMRAALRAGVNFFFWEPRYLELTRFLRRSFAGQEGRAARLRREEVVIAAGSFEGDRHGIERDLAQALRRLGTDYIDVFLLLWVRSPERLSDEVKQCLRELKASGRIRACGFSTHHRDLAEQAITVPQEDRVFDVLMLRHSAAHPGAEDRLLPLCDEREVGVITFSTLCYGRLLAAASASECYRYSLQQAGVSACWSAPRSAAELRENLEVLPSLDAPLSGETIAALRDHGQKVRQEDRRFNALLRKGHEGAPEALKNLDLVAALDAEGAQSDDEPYREVPGAVVMGTHFEEEWAPGASFNAAMERRGRP